MVLEVKTIRSIPLQHRAFFIDYAAGADLAVVASSDGNISIANLADSTVEHFSRMGKIEDIAIDPSGQTIAAVDQGSGMIKLLNQHGALLAEHFCRVSDGDWQGKLRCKACCFTFDSSGLITVAPDEDGVRVELVAIDRSRGFHLSAVNSVVVDLPFVDCGCSLTPTSMPNVVNMFNGAGQDGQVVHFLTLADGKISCDSRVHLDDVPPPVFRNESNEYFTVADNEVQKYTYPNIVPDAIFFSDDSDDDDNLFFSYRMCVLGGNQALVSVNDDSCRLFNTSEMTIGEEISLPGRLDIHQFQRMGDNVVFTCRADSGKRLEGWQDELVIVPVREILNAATRR